VNYPVEIHAPDIVEHRAGFRGVDYVQSFESEVRGPHVCVNAVMHGNEICGAIGSYLFDSRVCRNPVRLATRQS